MLKKVVIVLASAALLLNGLGASAQTDRAVFFTLQGGASLFLGENTGAFIDNKCFGDLFYGQGGASVGFYFNTRCGMRISGEISNNRSAANYQEFHHHFYPYTFKSANGFVDFILNCGNVDMYKDLNVRVFAGLGMGHTYNFSILQEPPSWYEISEPNNAFGMRAGIIVEYLIRTGFGFFIEGCAERFTDGFNGVRPNNGDTALGYPFDFKINASFGVALHF